MIDRRKQFCYYIRVSVSYYNEISGGHIGRAVVRRRCSAGPVLPLWLLPLMSSVAGRRHKLEQSLLVDPHIAMFSADVGKLFSILLKM